MHLGILLKGLGPLTVYICGLLTCAMALFGNQRYALMLVTFLLPLRNVIEKVQGYPLGTQFIDLILLCVLVGGLISLKKTDPSNLRKSKIGTMGLLTVIYMFFSLIWGGYYLYGGFTFDTADSRVQDWKNFALMPLLFFLNFRHNLTKNDIWTIIGIMCCSIFVVDFYTINEIRNHSSSLLARDQVTGTFQFLGPNEVAGFLNEYTIILLSVLYAIKVKNFKWLLLVIILADLYCITFLYSRGAYLGLIFGLLILFAFKDKKMLLPLFLVLILWQNVLPQNVVDRIRETKTEYGELDKSSQDRLVMWHAAIDCFKSSPVIGIGWGSFRHLGLILGDTHNIYVKFLAEQGLIGISIFFLTIILFIKEGWMLYQKGDDDLSKSLGLGFVCCIAVLMVNNAFGDRWSYLEPNAYLWIFAGLVARLNVIAQVSPAVIPQAPRKDTPKTIEETPKKKKIRYYDLP